MAGRMSVEWSALPYDIVHKIGDCFLETEDLDYYASFRAVCGHWRRATMKPEFYLSNWILFDDSLFLDGSVTLLNLHTGRYLLKTISKVISRYYFVGATNGGLFVLGQKALPYKTRLFNPLTGAITRFWVHIPAERVSAITMTKSPMMLFVSNRFDQCIGWADKSSPGGPGRQPSGFGEQWCMTKYQYGFLSSMTLFAGELYITDNFGAITSTNTQSQPCTKTVMIVKAIAGPDFEWMPGCSYNFYLVESDGELLLVISGHVQKGAVVYRVDTNNSVLEPVCGIGSRALFVSLRRCISIDTRIHNTVQPGSIYYADLSHIRSYDDELQSWEAGSVYVFRYGVDDLKYSHTPCSLGQLLADYCRRAENSEFYYDNGITLKYTATALPLPNLSY